MQRFEAGLSAAQIMLGCEHPPWPLGAHLVARRAGYLHHGIYTGRGRVIHYAGLCDGLGYGPIEEVSLLRFAGKGDVWSLKQAGSEYSPAEVLTRAHSRLGECRYRLLTNNCEHFCHWCLHGKPRSDQVRRFWRDPVFAMNLIAHVGPQLFNWLWTTRGAEIQSQG